MDIKELGQKYNTLEERISRIETYLRTQYKRRETFFKMVHEAFNEEPSSQSSPQQEGGD